MARPAAPPAPDCSVARCIALTFDDGPSEWTPQLLQTLAANDARATFFVSGSAVAGGEHTVRTAALVGHQIGSHSFHHVRMTQLPQGEDALEIAAADDLIAPFIGGSKSFRPPYGDYDNGVRRAAAARGYSIVMWNLDPLDYRETDPAVVVSRVLASARRGSVILSHDTLPHTVTAYATIIPALKQAGYELVTVDQLLGPGAAGQVRGGYS